LHKFKKAAGRLIQGATRRHDGLAYGAKNYRRRKQMK